MTQTFNRIGEKVVGDGSGLATQNELNDFKKSMPYFDVQGIKNEKFPNDSNYDNALKEALKNVNSVSFYTKVLFPRKSTKYTFNSTTPIVLKDNVFIEFEAGAELEYIGTADSLFTNDPTTASLFLRVFGGGRFNVNDKKIFNFRYSKGQTYGCKVTFDDLRFDGTGTNRLGTALSIGYTDFLYCTNLSFTDLEKGIEIVADNTWTRGNTQIVLDTISMVNVKTGVEFDRLDKASFRNVDIAHCDVGFLGHSSNQLVYFLNCHVEYYDSYAFKYDGSANMNISYEECSCFLPSDSAKGGFYSPQLDWTAKGQNHYVFNNPDFIKSEQVEAARSAEVKSATGYTPYVGFYCPSPFEWNGLDFEHPNFNKVNNDYPVGSAIINTTLKQEQSENLLPLFNFDDLTALHSYQGTPTITSNSDYYNGIKITWDATAGNVIRMKSKVPLRIGWHTVVLNASQVQDKNVNFLISKPNFTTLLNQNIAELSLDFREGIRPRKTGIKSQSLVIPFYVDTAGEHYFSFYAPTTNTFEISSGGIQLYHGFVNEFKNLSKNGVLSIKELGAIGDGVNYDTQAFINASRLNRPLILPPGTYRVNKTSDLTLPSVKCLVGYATIIVEDAYGFVINSNFEMSHVKIISKNTYTKTDSTLKSVIKANADLENVSFDDVVFDSVLSAQDGTVRASAAISLKGVKNLKLDKIKTIGYRQGVSTNGLSDGIIGTNLEFYNVELPLYMRGSDPAVTDENYAKNIQFSNITHINTQVQSQNYFKQAGADTILMEKCDTITISNVISEYPVERSCYFSCCRNATADHWNLKNALGIKFVGGSNTALNLETIARNCKLSNIHVVIDDATLTQQAYIAEFYWAKDWSVKSSTLKGNGIASVLISTRHYIEDGLIENCSGSGLKRGLFEYSYVGTVDNPDPTPDIAEGNYTAGVNGLTIRDCTVNGSHTIDYDVIKLQDSSPPTSGSYRYKNIVLDGIRVNNISENYGIASSNMSCKGLINIDSVDGLRIKDCKVYGYYRTDVNGNPITLPFQVGANSKNVSIKHEETVRNQDFKYNFGTLYVSADSEFKINTINKLFSYQDTATITVKHDSTDVSITKDLKNTFRMRGTTHVTDSSDFALPVIGSTNSLYPLPNLFGMIDVIVDTGDVGGYTITKTGVVALKANSSAFFVLSTTDNKFAFFKDTSPRYVLRYKSPTSVIASFVINYTLSAS